MFNAQVLPQLATQNHCRLAPVMAMLTLSENSPGFWNSMIFQAHLLFSDLTVRKQLESVFPPMIFNSFNRGCYLETEL